MRYGLTIPPFAHPRDLVRLGEEAEAAGWDGYFVWDHLKMTTRRSGPLADAWAVLSALAVRTERIRIGTLVTPVARRRPWVLARQTATADVLSGGRLILGVGLGSPAGPEFADFGEDPDERVRAEKLDEGLEVLTGLWTGQPFAFHGRHYQAEEATFLPTPVQRPRIPVWVAGMWPHRPPMRRAARWDGAFPLKARGDPSQHLTPDDIRDIAAFIRPLRASTGPFDLLVQGRTQGGEADEDVVRPFEEAGATWWIEMTEERSDWVQRIGERIGSGPPRN